MHPLRKSMRSDEKLVAFMSIKPEFANKIISGMKRYEYRKYPINVRTSHVIIYSTSPEKVILGVAEVDGIQTASPTAIWEKTKHSGGITRRLFRDYFKNKKTAHAIKLKNILPFDKKIKPTEIEKNFKVPQSFMYVGRDFVNKALFMGTNIISRM